ncbi:MAG: NADPH-dependent F420 reductase [Methanolinea sp.]|nr:NADPH-dependent F420 reductase [Methanolinea sp.]
MRVGIVGGTGDIGEGLAMRLSSRHEVIIGSRDEGKAAECSRSCVETLRGRGLACSCEGATNQEAIDRSDIVILAIPFRHVESTLQGLHGFSGKIVVSPVNPIEKGEYFRYAPPPEGSAALMIRRLLPPDARLCTAFNTVAANKWRALDQDLHLAVPVCGDDREAKAVVMALAASIEGIRAYDAGPLAASCMVESLTPLLLNIARFNRMRDVGIEFR